jgi:hypothetical protein
MVVVFFIYTWKVRESACYHEKRAIYATTEYEKGMPQVQKMTQQLQQTQSAMEAMQQGQEEWKYQQLVLMHEEYNCAIKEYVLLLQIENLDTIQPVQQSDDDAEAQAHLLQQLQKAQDAIAAMQQEAEQKDL